MRTRASARVVSAAVAACCGAGVLIWHAAAQPVASAAGVRAAPAAAVVRAATARACAPPPRQAGGIRSDLFGTPAPPAPAPAHAAPKAAPAPPAPPAPPDPLASYVYDGIATIGGKRFALVEDRDTHAGHYLRVGDTLAGFVVAGFDATALRLAPADGGRQRDLAMNDDYSLVPLDKGARRGGQAAARTDATAAAAHYERLSTVAVVDGAAWLLSTAGGEDVQKLGNDLFDGRITQEQFDQRVGSGNKLRFTMTARDLSANVNRMEVQRADVVLEDAVAAPED